MEDRYGSLWADRYGAFPRERVKHSWAEDLADLSKDELARGIIACRERPFPPTLPEFRLLCRPAINPEAAFAEACKQIRLRDRGEDTWSHPAIFFAAQAMGRHDMLSMPWIIAKARWSDALAAELAKRQWPEIPAAAAALPKPEDLTLPQVEAIKRVDSIKQMLAEKMVVSHAQIG